MLPSFFARESPGDVTRISVPSVVPIIRVVPFRFAPGTLFDGRWANFLWHHPGASFAVFCPIGMTEIGLAKILAAAVQNICIGFAT